MGLLEVPSGSRILTLSLRLGQKLDVKIYKLTIDETVEDRKPCGCINTSYPELITLPGILELQNQKRELARAALSGEGAKNIAKLSLNDIMGASFL